MIDCLKKAAPFAILVFASACGGPRADDPTNVSNEETIAPLAREPATSAPDSACQAAVFEDASLTVCTADPARHQITMALGKKDAAPFRSLATLAANRPADAPLVAFAMNGGMFAPDGKPIGYYVENGDRRQPLNRNDGTGNFHLKPNGVFYGTGGKWGVRTSDDFYENVTDRPQFGTQSGPMLVINGELHPDIADDGDALALRNGVGIDTAGRAVFVISNVPVSFGKLARYYRNVIKARQALYLDGTVSALWDPESNRMDHGAALGPLIVVEKRAKASQ